MWGRLLRSRPQWEAGPRPSTCRGDSAFTRRGFHLREKPEWEGRLPGCAAGPFCREWKSSGTRWRRRTALADEAAGSREGVEERWKRPESTGVLELPAGSSEDARVEAHTPRSLDRPPRPPAATHAPGLVARPSQTRTAMSRLCWLVPGGQHAPPCGSSRQTCLTVSRNRIQLSRSSNGNAMFR